MVSLSGFLTRRRWWVVAAWLITVVVAAPMAAKQTEHLSGGGFDVPGSQSQAVETAITKQFTESQEGRIAVVFEAEAGAGSERAAAAVDRVAAEINSTDDARLTPAAADRAKAQLAAGEVAIAPVQASSDADELVNTATDIREVISPGESFDGITPYLVGQPAIWAALSEVSKEDLETAEAQGFPIVALI
jgi:uncharacterized membrane protein YdfJ with MMPL/SSD domain